jgi:uncharacterized membrane protein YkvA (DUF1232 family)
MTNNSKARKLSWTKAYFRFLKSPDESLLLKVAPLVIIGVIPADLLSNIIPVLGIIDDVGLSGVGIFTILRIVFRVRKYRYISSDE